MTAPGLLRRAVAAALGLTVVATAAAMVANADTTPRGRLTVVGQTDHSVRLLLTATGLPAGSILDGRSVSVTVDGSPAPVRSATPAVRHSGRSSVRREVLLVVDTSGSMAGAGIAGAKAAALAFLHAVPADVEVGLVAFADRPSLLVQPTRSRARVQAAVTQLVAAGQTSLYDGIALGLRVLGRSGERTVIVLSDGADTRSQASENHVAGVLHRSGVRMDAVALNTGDAVRASLRHLASAAHGQVTPVGSADQLAAAFSEAAHTFATRLTLDVDIPAAARGHAVDVTAVAPTGAGTVRASTSVHVGTTASTRGDLRSVPSTPEHAPWLLLGLVFAGLAGLAYVALGAAEDRRSPESRTKRLLSRYSFGGTAAHAVVDDDASKVGSSGIVRRALAVADRVADRPGRREKLVTRLARADVSLKPGEWLLVLFVVVLVAVALGTLLFGSLGFGLVIGLIGYLVANGWLRIKGHRRLKAFEEQLPDSLQLVAGSLSAGFSLAQALDGVVREGLEPIAGELQRALAEARLGMVLEDALDGIAERMDSTDFRWVVMAIRIQREVGGNLAEVLLNTAGMMRERGRLRRQVKALSAEGRMSAYVLFAIPIFMSLYLLAFRRAYIRTLYTDPIGIGMLVAAVVLAVSGAFWMKKIVTVEV